MSKPGLILFKFIGANSYKQLANKTYYGGTKCNPVYKMIKDLRKSFAGHGSVEHIAKRLETAVEYLQNDGTLTKFLDKKKGVKGFLSNDISNVYAAIAEIFACYDFKNAGFKVFPIDENNQKPTPDFKIEDTNGKVAYVEVNCKNYEKNNNTVTVCSNSVYNFQNGTKMVSCTSIHSPFGKTTKPTENSIIQAIQKISQIKQGSKQAVNGKPFILYIDLDTGNIRGMSHLFDTTYPIHYSKDGEITSEIIWHAMYGKKGYPIFERHPYYMLPCSKSWWYKLKNKLVKHKNTIPFDKLICTMNHDGRFLTDHYVSAVIFRCENHVIICENQYANNKLHRSTRLHLKRIPKVDIAKSILNLIPGMIIFKNMRYRYIVRRLLF